MKLVNVFRQRPWLIDCLIIAIIVGFSAWLMWHTFGYDQGQLVIASKVWSDFGAHIPLVRSFSMATNLPPEYPHFAGEPIRYHFLFYALVGWLEKVGIHMVLGMNLLSTVGMSLFLGLVYEYASKLFKNRLAGVVAVFLVLFNGSLTFIDYFSKQGVSLTSLLQLIELQQFANFGPWNGDLISAFWNLNIYTNQRHVALSFGVILALLWTSMHLSSKKGGTLTRHKKLILAMVLTAALAPLLHKAIVPVVGLMALSWWLFHRELGKSAIILLFILGLVSLPALGWLSGGESSLMFQPGFLAPEKSINSWLRYWWFNGGLYLPLLLPVFLWGNRQVRAILLGAVGLFAIANIWQLSPDMINNHKLINLFFIFMAICIAGFLVFLGKKGVKGKVISLLLFIGLTFSGVVDLFPIINDYSLRLNDVPQSQTAFWVQQNTAPDAVFLPADKFYNPASLVGRKLYFGYSYFPWSMGYATQDRETVSRQIFAPNISQNDICSLLVEEGIDYVILSAGKGEIGDTDVRTSSLKRDFSPQFYSETEQQFIYSVEANCQN